MSRFLDHIESFTGPQDTVLFRSPMNAHVSWDVNEQRLPTGKKYRIGVNFGAQIVVNDRHDFNLPLRQIRKLMAGEVYGEFDEITTQLIQLQAKLYNIPDKEAQDMASDLNFILISIKEATS